LKNSFKIKMIKLFILVLII